MDTRTLLLLVVGALIVWVAFQNPALGIALGVGVAVVALLDLLTKDGSGGNGGDEK